METALEATPTLNGHLKMNVLLIVLQCCSTSHSNAYSEMKRKEKQLSVTIALGLFLQEVVTMSYVLQLSLLTVKEIVHQMQIRLDLVSQKKVERTCLLTGQMEGSQLQN
jgi:hypothetical protein